MLCYIENKPDSEAEMLKRLESIIRHALILLIRDKGYSKTVIDPRYHSVFYQALNRIGCYALTPEEIRKEEEIFHRRKPNDEVYFVDGRLIPQT